MARKNKIQNPLTLKQSYIYYIKDLSEQSKYYVSESLYRDICEDFNKDIILSIVDGEFFNLPYRMGIIRIKKRKVDLKNLKPDFGTFNKQEIKSKFLNEHTGGYYCRFYWDKKNMIVKHKTWYSFIPTRHNKRYLSNLLQEKGKQQINLYFE